MGQVALWISTILCGGALVLYIVSLRSGSLTRGARVCWYVQCVVLAVAAAVLWRAILGHDYAYEYVVGYTSNDLGFWYLLSAFWAGQEGSFLLWAILTGAIGLFLSWRASDYERETMVWVALVQLCVFVLMLLKSPFAPVAGQVPSDGSGLNPLLQNPWMVIHPPLVFLGYAAMVLPFAFAMAALMKREYEGWVTRSLPWCGFAWLTLGAGIIVGGYWAYETLGWGGYWGWDPVENASLVPWLIGTALLHGLIVQKSTGSLRPLNFFLAAFSFVAVVYGTYLTRSGVLGDFSVHSFADIGAGYNACLLAFVGVPLAAWAALFLARKGEIHSDRAYENPRSLAFVLHLGIIVLLVSAGLVGIGMSSPILTGLLAKEPSAVSLSFYNVTHTPIGILVALLVLFAPVMPWRGATWASLKGDLKGPALVGLLGLLATVAGTVAYARASAGASVGVSLAKSVPWYLLIGLAATALGTNLAAVVSRWRMGKRLLIGAPLAHTGLALMLMSFVGSSAYDREHKITLGLGETKAVMGYKVTHRGSEVRKDGKLQINVDVERGDHVYNGKALMYETKHGLMRTPAIQRGFLADLYVEPESVDPGDAESPHGAGSGDTVDIAKGESKKVGPYKVTFEAFDMSAHGKEGGMSVGAKLKIDVDGKTEEVTPQFVISGQETSHPPTEFDGGAATVRLMSMTVESGTVHLSFAGAKIPASGSPARSGKETLLVQVTHKPMMVPLWLGCILLLTGAGVAIRRRAADASAELGRRERRGKGKQQGS